jgi:hypothetical protein
VVRYIQLGARNRIEDIGHSVGAWQHPQNDQKSRMLSTTVSVACLSYTSRHSPPPPKRKSSQHIWSSSTHACVNRMVADSFTTVPRCSISRSYLSLLYLDVLFKLGNRRSTDDDTPHVFPGIWGSGCKISGPSLTMQDPQRVSEVMNSTAPENAGRARGKLGGLETVSRSSQTL